ncbi:MAG: conjugal transfer protein TraB [Thermomicrobiales bacterium]|nr:TraB/VirB10 family protein [Fimbriimonadaceae bacterium]TXG80679.1 MAG: conjugal transfer protein TraB [Thermomicrobiales bacterium]
MMRVPVSIRERWTRVPRKTRQWLFAGGLLFVTVGALSVIFAAAQDSDSPAKKTAVQEKVSKVTNVGVMPGGEQVKPLDQWIGQAGRKVERLEADKQDRDKKEQEAAAFRQQVLDRFAKLEQSVRRPDGFSGPPPSQAAAPTVSGSPVAAPPPPMPQTPYPPAGALPSGGVLPPHPGAPAVAGRPAGVPVQHSEPVPQLVRVSLADNAKRTGAQAGSPGAAASKPDKVEVSKGNVDTYLPVSFTRGVMLGGLDAPTGGNAQSNPHPVLIRLEDNAVLPNRFRSNVRECFVIAAGYGDIASERAYMRTESLSCIRNDGSALEVKIQGSVFGEDGLVGVRGRLVTKQGQMLANALLAGLISGFGQGLSNYNTTVSQSTFGTVSTTEGSQSFRQGIGTGVGKALDRLANYYIKLAESTFPIIEVGAGRSVDVVITKGVRIDGGDPAKAEAAPAAGVPGAADRIVHTGASDDY